MSISARGIRRSNSGSSDLLSRRAQASAGLDQSPKGLKGSVPGASQKCSWSAVRCPGARPRDMRAHKDIQPCTHPQHTIRIPPHPPVHAPPPHIALQLCASSSEVWHSEHANNSAPLCCCSHMQACLPLPALPVLPSPLLPPPPAAAHLQ
eukprot:360269-Chlamydomonas_euryale.AAC.2